MNTNLQLSAEEILGRVRQLYAQLRLLGETGTTRHSAAYTELVAEIRVWADRYSKISEASVSTHDSGLRLHCHRNVA